MAETAGDELPNMRAMPPPPDEEWPQQPENRPKPKGPELVLEPVLEQPAEVNKQPVIMRAANRLRYIVSSFSDRPRETDLGGAQTEDRTHRASSGHIHLAPLGHITQTASF